MWDPEQLAEIPVIIDRLQAAGDPLGEWLAIRMRLDAHDQVFAAERRALRRRARALREQLGPRLILADNPRLGRPHAVREQGFLVDVSFAEASPDRLAELFARPDAPLLLRLRLRGDLAALRSCVELLGEPSSQPGMRPRPNVRVRLRELALELHDSELGAQLEAHAEAIAGRLPSLFSLLVDARPVALPFDLTALERAEPWSGARRTTLGRALASSEPERRRKALERLREHGVAGNQLRSVLLAIIEGDPEPRVRQAAFAVVPQLGRGAHALIAHAVDTARDREDSQLHDWLAVVRSL